MRSRSSSSLLVVFFVCLAVALPAFAQPAPAAPPSTTDPVKVEAFLRSLEDAISVGNHMRVASFVKYPLEAWIDGEKLTLRNDSQLMTHYRQIFDSSLQKSLSTAKADSFTTGPQGVAVCGGRLVVGQASDKNATLKIVKIGEPATR